LLHLLPRGLGRGKIVSGLLHSRVILDSVEERGGYSDVMAGEEADDCKGQTDTSANAAGALAKHAACLLVNGLVHRRVVLTRHD
jgi:hypothetical protein